MPILDSMGMWVFDNTETKLIKHSNNHLSVMFGDGARVYMGVDSLSMVGFIDWLMSMQWKLFVFVYPSIWYGYVVPLYTCMF